MCKYGQSGTCSENIPIDSNLDRFISEDVEVDGKVYKVTGVSMGNPHAVTFIDDTDSLEIEKIGPKFENAINCSQRKSIQNLHR